MARNEPCFRLSEKNRREWVLSPAVVLDGKQVPQYRSV